MKRKWKIGLWVSVLLVMFYATKGKISEKFHKIVKEYSEGFVTSDTCEPGRPCSYPDQVHLRVLVLTFDRPNSLLKLLESLDDLELDGDKASLEIWIDRDKKTGQVDTATLSTAVSFRWKKGPCRVHVQKKHVGIYGQWIDVWRPPENTGDTLSGGSRSSKRELGLILEDDLSISKFAYRWLRAVDNAYGNRTDYGGAAIQGETLFTENKKQVLGPKSDTVFMYKLLSTWGFSPSPTAWRNFQDWFHIHKPDQRPEFRPYVPGILPTKWYQRFESQGKTHTMWSMWYIYYLYIEQLYVVHSNLIAYTGKPDTCLSLTRKERGLHSSKQAGSQDLSRLLKYWRDDFTQLPKVPTKVSADGSFVKSGTY